MTASAEESVRVHFASSHGGPVKRDGIRRRLIESHRVATTSRCSLHDDPSTADLIIYTDPPHDLFPLTLIYDPHYWRYACKSFVYSDSDDPMPVIPGVYCSMLMADFDPDWHAGGSYIGPGIADWMSPLPWSPEPRYLFSFVGSCETHPIRQTIRSLFQPAGLVLSPTRASVEAAFRSGNSTASEELRQNLVRVAGRSDFVLCPRGAGASSMRLFEVMGMGRAPVIISDAWVLHRDPTGTSAQCASPSGR
jgi:hypothetical protein